MARILIVEDDPENRLLLETAVRALGHEAGAVGDGLSALSALAVDRGELADDPDAPAFAPEPPTGAWDLVLMDVRLPGPDGRVVARRLRDQGWTGSVIAVTGLAMSGDRESCLEAGMDAYLAKPYTLESLREILDGVLGA